MVVSLVAVVNSIIVPWAMVFDRCYEIDSGGISVQARIGPGRIPWKSFRWVRVVASTRLPRPQVAFWLASRRGGVALTVDVPASTDAADRVASAISRYAPWIRRKGLTELVKWDPAGRVDGEFVVPERSIGELGWIFAISGAIWALSWQLAPFLASEILPVNVARAGVGLAYLILVAAFVGPATRMVSTDARFDPRLTSPRTHTFARAGGLSVVVLSAMVAVLLAF